MHLSLLIPLTGAAMNALCIFIIRLLDKDFIEAYKKTLELSNQVQRFFEVNFIRCFPT